jgi:hypothetical protein
VSDLAAETLDIRSGVGDILGILEAQRSDLCGKVDDCDDVSGNPNTFHDRYGARLIIGTTG